MVKKWVYKVIQLSIITLQGESESYQGELNDAGNDGWELVSIVYDGSTRKSVAYLKKEQGRININDVRQLA